MKHVSDEAPSYYERRLMREIEAIEARIVELKQEQRALKRQLLNARWESHSLRDVTRKNSANRVMVEERILSILRDATKPVPNAKLYDGAKSVNFELKPNTFRTYLLRLKEKGLIENPRRGAWRLSKTALAHREQN